MKSSIALLLSVLFLAGCSTDLEVNAPYKNITVVYGLLDKDKTRQYIKINKAFLGDGDALVYALIPDSNEYRPGEITEAYVEDLDNGTQYPLQDTLIENRITGTFYSPQQTVHYFDANDLDPDHLYRLFVRAKGEVITAETPVVDDLLYVSGFLNVNGPSKLNLKQGANYTTPEVRVTSGKHARRYDLYYRIIWDEETANGTTEKSLRRLIGTARTDGLNGNEGIDIAFNGESFFETIGNAVPTDPAVTKRRFKRLDLEYECASDEFTTYLTLSEPISGIVEERPEYTNVTNGYGLMGSRYFNFIQGVKLGDDSQLELVTGQYTNDLLFCIDGVVGGTLGCD